MWFRILLIATAALELSAPGCLADVATLNAGSGLGAAKQQELLLPFNDLLPPLLDSEVEAGTTATTEAFTTHVTKRTTESVTRTLAQTSTTLPTKKSYYQQQQQQQVTENKNKDLQPKAKVQQLQPTQQNSKIEPKAKPHEIQLLSLDLLPPFESDVANEVAETQQKEHLQTTTKPNVAIKPKQLVAKPSKHVPIVAKPAVPVKPVHLPVVASNIRNQTPHTAKQHQQQPQQHYHVGNAAAAGSVLPQHFADYSYQHTTRRPARGPLPTLTPFPKHFRK